MQGVASTASQPQRNSDPDHRSTCGHLRTNQLKRLLWTSRVLNLFSSIILFYGVSCILVLFTAPFLNNEELEQFGPVFLWFGAVGIFASIALFMRTTLGIIGAFGYCALFMISFTPIGMILSTLGIFILIKSSALYKPQRIKHGDLKKELKRRKRNKKKRS